MKYILPRPKPEWKIRPQHITELEEAFKLMNRCAEIRPTVDEKDLKQVERYQFESQWALDKAHNARGHINLVNYYEPIEKEIKRFMTEDYMSFEAVMALSEDAKKIKRLEEFFRDANGMTPKTPDEKERQEKDYRNVYVDCLQYLKVIDELPVQSRNAVYMMLVKIHCNMSNSDTTIDNSDVPRDLIDPAKGYEYACKIVRADGGKPFVQEKIEKQMKLNSDGTLRLKVDDIRRKKRTKRILLIILMVVLGIVAVITAAYLLLAACAVFAFYIAFKVIVDDITNTHSAPSAPKFGPNNPNYGGAQCGRCSYFNHPSCPRYPGGHPNDPACSLINKPQW